MTPSILRTLHTLAGSIARPPLMLLETGIVPMRVWPSDADVNVHMNNGRYLSLMDLGRLDLLVRTGLWRPLVKNGWRPVLGSATVRFRRPLPLMAAFELHSRLACWDSKWFFMEHRFVRDGASCGVALVKGLFRAGARNVTPSELLKELGLDRASPPMSAEISAWLEAESVFAAADRAGRARRGASELSPSEHIQADLEIKDSAG